MESSLAGQAETKDDRGRIRWRIDSESSKGKDHCTTSHRPILTVARGGEGHRKSAGDLL